MGLGDRGDGGGLRGAEGGKLWSYVIYEKNKKKAQLTVVLFVKHYA